MQRISDFFTLQAASKLIKQRKLSAVELLEIQLKRIKLYDKQLNSFIFVCENEALAAARIADSEIASGRYKGPLHGIPIGLKDVYDTAGIPTTCHSKILQHNIPSQNAYSVERLKQAGAIILGKLATHEFAFGGPSFDLPWPPARNPWDISRFTGGSSSGTAAAVASGLVLGGTATDTGGSARTPAAYCGITGLKPTYGLISRTGISLLAPSLDHAALMAWNTEDCALLLQAMAGYDPSDPASVNFPIPDYSAKLNDEIKGLRIGFLRHFYTTTCKANPAVYNAIETAARKFEEMGCIVEEIELSPISEWAACGNLFMFAEAFSIHKTNLQNRFTDYGEIFRDRMVLGGLFTEEDYHHALCRKREFTQELDNVMKNFDIILTATTFNEAPKVEAVTKFSILERPALTIAFNLTGNPAMSLCCGFTDTRLPLSMQLIAKRFDEVTLLQVANAYENATPWRNLRPPDFG